MRDLSGLSNGEREILRLLGEGHTAKSVARLTGLSVAAVNERLRTARRKAAAPSSRELARELRLQENRDEKIDLLPAADRMATPAVPTDTRVGWRIVMPVLTIAALAAVMMGIRQAHVAPHDAPATDPSIGQLVTEAALPGLHRLVRSESRDEPWATATEAALRARYARVPSLSGKHLVRIVCGKSLCEVAIAVPPDAVDLFAEVHSRALFDDIAALGLKNEGSGYGENFVFYWSRT